MMQPPTATLETIFGARLQRNAPLARHTSARVGGPADALVSVSSASELAEAAQQLWALDIPFTILGGGSNVLVSDAGVRGVLLLNRARSGAGMRFDESADPPCVWVESGVSLGGLARLAAAKGLGGLAWAAGIPGTVGGAVIGNAGAHGSDMAGQLIVAEILQRNGRRDWQTASELGFAYRSSLLKQQPGRVVLAAQLGLQRSSATAVQEEMERYAAQRRRSQPPGASMGSMFKNPPGDYAGHLIDAAGLKGTRAGGAEISPAHGNFFVNHGDAQASDIYKLIILAQRKVEELFGVKLELEITLVGEWINVER